MDKLHGYTTEGLHKWTHKVVEKLGWMVMAKSRNDTSMLTEYKKCIKRLCSALEEKIETIHDPDTREDLLILKTKVEILMQFVKDSGL